MSTVDPYQSLIGQKVPFCTPFLPKAPTEIPASQCGILNIVENYFNWGDTLAVVPRGSPIDNEVALIKFPRYSSKAQEIFCKILLVLSYMTAIVPLIMLIAKAIFRSGTQNYTITKFQDETPRLNQEESDEENDLERGHDQTDQQMTQAQESRHAQQGNNALISAPIEEITEINNWMASSSGLNPLATCRGWATEKCWNLLKVIAAIVNENEPTIVGDLGPQDSAQVRFIAKKDFLRYLARQLIDALNDYVVDRGRPGASVHPDIRSTWTEERKIDSQLSDQSKATNLVVIQALAAILREDDNFQLLGNRIYSHTNH